MTVTKWLPGLLAVAGMITWSGTGMADRGGKGDDNANVLHADMRGYDETPSVSSTGSGEFTARISRNEDAIDYDLSYQDLEGPTILFAHIHLGERHIQGGVSAFLCGGGGKPACPPAPAEVHGRIVAADVVGPAAQGIAAGELDELIRALRAGAAYANVHTDKQPSGEIRGQIRSGD